MALPLLSFTNVRDIQQFKLNKCIDVFRECVAFPDDYAAVKIFLGAVAANYLPGDPVWLMLIGPHIECKTVLFSALKGWKNVQYLSAVDESKLLCDKPNGRGEFKRAGYLAKLKEEPGVFIFSDFASVLTASSFKLPGLLHVFQEIYKGHWSRDSDDLYWDGRCGVLAGSTTLYDAPRYAGVMGPLGEYFVHYRFPVQDRQAIEEQNRMRNLNYNRRSENQQAMQVAVHELLEPAIARRSAPVDVTPQTCAYIDALGLFGSLCRTSILRNPYTHVVEHSQNTEDSARLSNELRSLFCGLITVGVPFDDTCNLLRKVMWSSIPFARAVVLQILLQQCELGNSKYSDGLRKLEDLYEKQTKLGIGKDHLRDVLRDLTRLRIIEQRPKGANSKSAPDGWRVPFETWDMHAPTAFNPAERL